MNIIGSVIEYTGKHPGESFKYLTLIYLLFAMVVCCLTAINELSGRVTHSTTALVLVAFMSLPTFMVLLAVMMHFIISLEIDIRHS